MARKRQNQPLQVLVNGRRTGLLTREASGAILFSYERDWLDWEHSFPVSLSLPLREESYSGTAVISFFENLLPDNNGIRRQVAARVKADGTDAYSLLSKIGGDCVGALQFLPWHADPGKPDVISGRPISDEGIARKIAALKTAPLGMDGEDAFRISIAGAQEKTALLHHDGQWMIPSGPTPTTHIIKPQIGQIPGGIDLSNSVENEYLCLRLCAAFGLPVANAMIEDFAGTKALSIERFDRFRTADGRLLRLPQEDICQALSVPPERKYQADGGPDNQAVMTLLKGSDSPQEDQRAYLKAQIVFWLIGATDGHAKNFSIFLLTGGRFRLTPLYDVLTAQPSVDAGQVEISRFKMAISAGNKNHYKIANITPRHFLQTAGRCDFDPAIIARELETLLDTGHAVAQACISSLPGSFPEELVHSTLQGMESRLRSIELWRNTN